jgi:hypothetical protein
VPYSYWYKPSGGSVIPEDVTLEDVTKERIATYRQFVAEPVDEGDLTSSWITGRPRALKAVKNVLGQSDYEAKAGVCTWLNGVYWIEVVDTRPDGLIVVNNLTEGAKRDVENVQVAIEPDLLYPLLRGRDVSRWRATPQAHILMVQDPQKRRGYDEDWLSVRLPKTHTYLKHFEGILRTRSGYRRYFRETDPFYSIFNVSDNTFAPYKVVWREVATRLETAVTESLPDSAIGLKCVVPDHTLIIVACNLRAEAHYLCALLNSSPSRFLVQNYIVIHPDTHVLKNVRIPWYDPNNPLHNRLATFSQQAHEATAAEDTAQVQAIEAEVDQLAAQLWELTSAELQDIQASLAELK